MRRLTAHAAVAILTLWGGTANAVPLSFNTALPVHQGGLLYRGQVIWTHKQGDPTALARQMDVVAVPSVVVYGATSKLALMGIFPFIDKTLKTRSTGGTRKASGLGDITTLARYQVFSRNRTGKTVRGALFAGLKWPTGNATAADSQGTLPRSVQLGTGSYDPIVGTVWTSQWLSFQIDADVLYQRKTQAGGFKAGDLLRNDLSLQYRLLPRNLKGSGVPRFLYGVLELNSIIQAKDESDGTPNPDSGGYQLHVVPGLQWVTKRTVFEVGAQLPLVQDLNGSSLRTDFSLISSFRFWF